MSHTDDYDERDYHQEYKDDLAEGLIYADGTPREQDPPDCQRCYSYDCRCVTDDLPGEPVPPGGYDPWAAVPEHLCPDPPAGSGVFGEPPF